MGTENDITEVSKESAIKKITQLAYTIEFERQMGVAKEDMIEKVEMTAENLGEESSSVIESGVKKMIDEAYKIPIKESEEDKISAANAFALYIFMLFTEIAAQSEENEDKDEANKKEV